MTGTVGGGGAAGGGALPAPVRKVHSNLLPLFVALVVCCYLDRTSLAFAALQLCSSDWFDARVYGVGSGMFYLSYVTNQIPSNLMLARFGARQWLPAITAAWGVVAACCALMHSPASFYALRLALGLTEAGAFPAMWFVCGQFYPLAYSTVPFSVIEASIALSQILAAPVAAALLQMNGVLGLAGWQWLFLSEGAATLVLAAVLRWRLPDGVETARFLGPDDKRWLLQQLAAGAEGSGGSGDGGSSGDKRGGPDVPRHAAWQPGEDGQQQPRPRDAQPLGDAAGKQLAPAAGCVEAGDGGPPCAGGGAHPPLSAWQQVRATFTNPLILYLCLLKSLKDVALDGLVYFLPLLIHALMDGSSFSLRSRHGGGGGGAAEKHCGGKTSQLHAVLLSAIPFGMAAAAALLIGRSSEVRQERRLHVGLPLLLGGAAFAAMPVLLLWSKAAAFLSLTAAVVAADATTGPFWSWVHMAALPGTGAVSLAAVNSVGKAGGFLGPVCFGLTLQATGSYLPSVLLVAAVLVLGGGLALAYPGEPGWRRRYHLLPHSGGEQGQQQQQQQQRAHGRAHGAASCHELARLRPDGRGSSED